MSRGRAPRPAPLPASPARHLEEGEAEQEEKHVHNLVDDQAAGKADHDEHARTHEDPVLGVQACDQRPQAPQQRPRPRRLYGSSQGAAGAWLRGRAGGRCPPRPPPSPASATVTSVRPAGASAFFSSFSLTNWRSRSQKVSVYNSWGEGRARRHRGPKAGPRHGDAGPHGAPPHGEV